MHNEVLYDSFSSTALFRVPYTTHNCTVLAERRILYVKLVVHEVTTGVYSINQIDFESFRITDGSTGIFEEIHWN